jgi:hypothetical protein
MQQIGSNRKKLSDEQYRKVLDAVHIVAGIVLFEFAQEPRNSRDTILRNAVARADMLARSIFALWDLRDYQDCWILHRCLLDRLFHLVNLGQTGGFEEFEAWSFLEQYKAVHRIESDPAIDSAKLDLVALPTPEQKQRARELFKCPPKWKRPKAEDVAKQLGMRFLYTYGYDHASAHVHPMANDGLQDFHTITGLEPAPTFPDQTTVLSNTVLVTTMILQEVLNASTMLWMALVYNALNDVREYLASGESDYESRLAVLVRAVQQHTRLSQPKALVSDA